MKNEKKLNQAINYINYILDACNIETAKGCAKDAKELLQEFLIDNMQSKKGTYNIQDYTGNDDMRPQLCGICYDPATKSAVATDAHLLVVDRAAYDQAIVDKYADKADGDGRITVDKYGNLIEYRYPNYAQVFPKKYKNAQNHTINIDDLNDYIKRCRAYAKVNQLGDPSCLTFAYKVGVTYFEARLLHSFLIATDGNITTDMDDCNCYATWYGEYRDALICPIYHVETDKNILGTDEGLTILRRNYNW